MLLSVASVFLFFFMRKLFETRQKKRDPHSLNNSITTILMVFRRNPINNRFSKFHSALTTKREPKCFFEIYNTASSERRVGDRTEVPEFVLRICFYDSKRG